MDERTRLERFATEIRLETMREIGYLGFGHVGGCMSVADVLAVLYGGAMRVDPKNPRWEERDWLVVSKGHAGPAVYAALALKGFFPMDWLQTLNKGGTNLPSHCDRNKTPGVDITTGSLGQGISAATGVALGTRLRGIDNTVFAIVGDGECNEGLVWEAVMFAGQQKLDNLVMLLDNNKEQIDDYSDKVMDLEDYTRKFEDFKWHAVRVDGHDVLALSAAIEAAKQHKGQPCAIVMDTVKGKGCTVAEGKFGSHHMRLSGQQVEESVRALEARLAAMGKEVQA